MKINKQSNKQKEETPCNSTGTCDVHTDWDTLIQMKIKMIFFPPTCLVMMPDNYKFQTSWKTEIFTFWGECFTNSALVFYSYYFITFNNNVENDSCPDRLSGCLYSSSQQWLPLASRHCSFPCFRILVWNELWKLATVNHIDHHIIL